MEPPILVCSGLASRGIDFPNVGHVIQFDFAGNSVDHLHRIGRTARAGASGLAAGPLPPHPPGLGTECV